MKVILNGTQERCKCGLIHVVLELAGHLFLMENDLSSYHLKAIKNTNMNKKF